MSDPTTGSDFVDVQPLREYYLHLEQRGLITAKEVAWRLGWVEIKRGKGGQKWMGADGHRVKRRLGLLGSKSRGKRRLQQKVRYDMAVELAEALGMDYTDAGV